MSAPKPSRKPRDARSAKPDADALGDAIVDVLASSAELQSLPVSALIQRKDLAMFDGIPSAKGGTLPCTATAMSALRDASDKFLAGSDDAGRLDPAKVYSELKNLIRKRFIEQRIKLRPATALKTFELARHNVSGRKGTYKYYFACNVAQGDEPDRVSIGPVTFAPWSKRKVDLASLLSPPESAQEDADAKRAEFRRADMEKIVAHYSAFGWIAEVEVLDFDSETSRHHAQRLVQAAMDALHLLIGARWSARMRIDAEYLDAETLAQFGVHEGKLFYTITRRSTSNHLPADWWSQVSDNAGPTGIDLLGTAIEYGAKPSGATHLGRRFLDALTWFGEGTREKLSSSRLVKFVTAIEAILLTGDTGSVTLTLGRRGATFLFGWIEGSFEDIERRFKRLYANRSAIVHGSLSPSKPESIRAELEEAEYLARKVLIRALNLYGVQGLSADNVTVKDVEKAYDVTLYRFAQSASENVLGGTSSNS